MNVRKNKLSEHETNPAHKCLNDNNCKHFNSLLAG